MCQQHFQLREMRQDAILPWRKMAILQAQNTSQKRHTGPTSKGWFTVLPSLHPILSLSVVLIFCCPKNWNQNWNQVRDWISKWICCGEEMGKLILQQAADQASIIPVVHSKTIVLSRLFLWEWWHHHWDPHQSTQTLWWEGGFSLHPRWSHPIPPCQWTPHSLGPPLHWLHQQQRPLLESLTWGAICHFIEAGLRLCPKMAPSRWSGTELRMSSWFGNTRGGWVVSSSIMMLSPS